MSAELMFVELLYKTSLSSLTALNKYFIDLVHVLKKNNSENLSGWYCNTYNTIGHYNLIADKNFSEHLHVNFISEIQKFAKEYGVSGKQLICDGAWINLAQPGSYQEFHIHAGSHFSLAYYLQVNQDSGKIMFRSHESNTDMLPLPVSENKIPNNKMYYVSPKINDLLIFRSNQQHAVMFNASDTDRISISANYKFI